MCLHWPLAPDVSFVLSFNTFEALAPELYAFTLGLLAPYCVFSRVHFWAIGSNIAVLLHHLTKPQLRMDRFRVFIESRV